MTKREIFHEKALSLIHKKGFKAMTMRDLALELSCDIKNLYNYTSSKSALLEELLFSISNDFHEGIDKILESNLNPVKQLEELIRLHVELSNTQPLSVGLLVNDWRSLSEEQLEKFNTKRLAYEAKVILIIEEGIERGYFRKINTQIAVPYLLSSLRWQYNYYVEEEKLNVLDTTKELSKLILPGMIEQS